MAEERRELLDAAVVDCGGLPGLPPRRPNSLPEPPVSRCRHFRMGGERARDRHDARLFVLGGRALASRNPPLKVQAARSMLRHSSSRTSPVRSPAKAPTADATFTGSGRARKTRRTSASRFDRGRCRRIARRAVQTARRARERTDRGRVRVPVLDEVAGERTPHRSRARRAHGPSGDSDGLPQAHAAPTQRTEMSPHIAGPYWFFSSMNCIPSFVSPAFAGANT